MYRRQKPYIKIKESSFGYPKLSLQGIGSFIIYLYLNRDGIKYKLYEIEYLIKKDRRPALKKARMSAQLCAESLNLLIRESLFDIKPCGA